jgi:ribosomal protein S18 acetylase RimI-like enzyme
MSAVAVRRAEQRDLDALLALYAELADGDATRLPGERTHAAAILAAALDDPRRSLLVAERDGAVVGTADLLVVPNLTHGGDPWATVENVVVATAARRSGIGRMLLAHAMELARAAGCYKLQLQSAKHRVEAHAFYGSLGLEARAEGFKLYFDDAAP